MSRYDRPDPGQDADYCDGLAPDNDCERCPMCGRDIIIDSDYCSDACRIDAAEDYKNER